MRVVIKYLLSREVLQCKQSCENGWVLVSPSKTNFETFPVTKKDKIPMRLPCDWSASESSIFTSKRDRNNVVWFGAKSKQALGTKETLSFEDFSSFLSRREYDYSGVVYNLLPVFRNCKNPFKISNLFTSRDPTDLKPFIRWKSLNCSDIMLCKCYVNFIEKAILFELIKRLTEWYRIR